jgi:hypothetical protein
MDVVYPSSQNQTSTTTTTTAAALFCTGSKDKSIAVSSVESLANGSDVPLWRSYLHTAKVGAVRFKGRSSTVLASASDDGIVALHDYRTHRYVGRIVDGHRRPHSVTWDPQNEHILATAGLDPSIKLWDWRNLAQPVVVLEGHVPSVRCRRIHRPTFFARHHDHEGGGTNQSYLLSGGEGSGSLSMYQISYDANGTKAAEATLSSRGKLPMDCGDAGSIAVHRNRVAVTVDRGEVLFLEPTK